MTNDRETQHPTVTITADTSRFNEAYERLLDKMPPRDQWLAKIRANPSDWQAMLVFADWLEESGDLLAAEQWRWIAVVCGDNGKRYATYSNALMQMWGNFKPTFPRQSTRERQFAAEHNIRCMPTYPLTIEDVQAYLETSQ